MIRAIQIDSCIDDIDLTDEILESGWKTSVILNLVIIMLK